MKKKNKFLITYMDNCETGVIVWEGLRLKDVVEEWESDLGVELIEVIPMIELVHGDTIITF